VRHDTSRWFEVTPSQFPHEREGLAIVRALLPDAEPFRAWSNFEFRDNQGKWHEVDLLVVGRRHLHLVELKYYNGELRGDDHRWLRDGRRAEDSPLKLARRKAQRLKTKLQEELLAWARETGHHIPDVHTAIPYVQEAVFLHHPGLRCLLPPASRKDLFGPDGLENDTGLPGISTRLLEPPTPTESVPAARSRTIAKLLERIGVVQRRQREVGSWIIDEQPLAEGDGWQDWPAFHRVAGTDRARIRFYVTPPGAATEERLRLRKAAEHEYRIMSRLAHDGLLKPRDIVDDELGTGLVYPHDENFRRLDLWLAEQRAGLPVATQLALIRQVAEAVAYAHRHRVVHRGLTPMAVHVRPHEGERLSVLVGDWQTAGRVGDTSVSGLSGTSLTVLGPGDGSAVAERLMAVVRPVVDTDRRFAEVFGAPEGVWNRSADRVRLDVFSLGALTYYVVTGRAPAPDRAALRERLHRDGGLDLAADLPQVSPALRRLVLDATRPVVSERLADVPTFLAKLAEVERELAVPEDMLAVDPLEAAPGAVLAGRFRLERRLGAGSTAVGLLVTDLAAGDDGERRVLKVAVDDPAARRLDDEAEVLRGLSHPRLVRLVEGPLDVGARRALLLENAGEQTLADVLRGRGRLSLDLLERWGTDLLEALVALDRAGVDHRDVKPANLGVREDRRGEKHLVLFDFSLARAGATAVTAGTPPYLDPFLENRGRYDSAAERYAAAVVLFEMATGAPPVYGDGQSDPLVVDDEAAVAPEMFDPSVAPALVTFFRTALARDARRRHDTAADMLAAWRAAFASLSRTAPDDAERRAAAARPETPLAEAGLSARALSAVEQLGVATVADLVAIDPVRLNRLPGVADPTRKEVAARAKVWRERFASEAARSTSRAGDGLPDPVAAAELLAGQISGRTPTRRQAARLLLGLEPGLDAFATQGELAQALGKTRQRGTQLLAELQGLWADDRRSRELLDAVAGFAREGLTRLGGVATVEELAGEVLGHLPPSDAPQAQRIAAGLLRLALDRAAELNRVEGLDSGEAPLAQRRRDGRVALLATDPLLLDAAEAAARRADALITEAAETGEALVPRQRAMAALAEVADRWVPGGAELTMDRLVRLAARLSRRAALSGHGELHDRDLSATTAVRLALAGLGARQPVTPQEVRDRVRARFPELGPLPERPRLDEVLAEARLPLVYDEGQRAYRAPVAASDTTGLGTRLATVLPFETGPVGGGYTGQRLRESARSRSFLALGIDAGRVDQAVELLRHRHGAVVVDITQVLVDALRAGAESAQVPWDIVQAADAAPPGSYDAMGLAALVEQALPQVEAAVTGVAGGVPEGTRPVVLTDVAPLARYGHLNLLARWTDLAARRPQAVWVVVPQLAGNHGPLIDGRPLPLAAPGQFLRLGADWFAETGVTTMEGVTP